MGGRFALCQAKRSQIDDATGHACPTIAGYLLTWDKLVDNICIREREIVGASEGNVWQAERLAHDLSLLASGDGPGIDGKRIEGVVLPVHLSVMDISQPLRWQPRFRQALRLLVARVQPACHHNNGAEEKNLPGKLSGVDGALLGREACIFLSGRFRCHGRSQPMDGLGGTSLRFPAAIEIPPQSSLRGAHHRSRKRLSPLPQAGREAGDEDHVQIRR